MFTFSRASRINTALLILLTLTMALTLAACQKEEPEPPPPPPPPPPPEELVFEIDTEAGSKPLPFRALSEDPNLTEVSFVFTVDAEGKAGDFERLYQMPYLKPFYQVRDCVRTWRYKCNCLEGKIFVVCNIPARRVIFDDSDLKPVPGFEDREIKRGRIVLLPRGRDMRMFQVRRDTTLSAR